MRITWKDSKVLSLKLKNGTYALLQMIGKNGQVAVFDCFRSHDDWSDLNQLNSSDILFSCYLVKSDLKKNIISELKHINPVFNIPLITWTINTGLGTSEKTLWAGTENEISFITLGEGNNLLCRYTRVNGELVEECNPIEIKDYEKYKIFEMSNLRGYPEFNERLYLCSLLNENIDPLKELAFGRPLDPICKTYVDIISGKRRIKELGY